VTTSLLLVQDQDRLGTIPDWIAALGTVAAFLVALRLLAKELAARREYEEDRRRAQASRVVCWLEVAPSTATFTPSSGGPSTTFPTGDHLELILHNGSDEPVFDCRIQVVLEPRSRSQQRRTTPGSSRSRSGCCRPAGPNVRNGTSAGPTSPTRTYGCCSPMRTTSAGSAATPAGSAGSWTRSPSRPVQRRTGSTPGPLASWTTSTTRRAGTRVRPSR
jgi:hypothetical protein